MDPIVQLTQTWRQGLAGQRLAGQLRAWATTEPPLRRFAGEPALLFRFLRTPPSAERDAVFCALLRRAKTDQLAGLAVLEALLPGLKKLLGNIAVETGQSDELLALLLEHAWERIVSYPVERRPARVAANLLLDTQHAALRALRRAPDEPPTVALDSNSQPFERPASEVHEDVLVVLHRAVKARAITAEEALLILYTRIGGTPLAALAAKQGVPYDALRIRRFRAERRFVLFLGKAGVRFKGRNAHMCTARSVALEVADSASGGAGT